MPLPKLSPAAESFLARVEAASGALPAAVGKSLAGKAKAKGAPLTPAEVAEVLLAAMPSVETARVITAAFNGGNVPPAANDSLSGSLFLTQLSEVLARKRAATPDLKVIGPATAPDATPDFILDVVYLGDSHSNLSRAPRAANVVKLAKGHSPNAIVMHTGDALMGTPLYPVGGHGRAEMKILKEMGIELYVPGNHDLDGGVDALVTALAEHAAMKVVCANWRIDGPLGERIEPYTTRVVDGRKVVIIGLSVDPAEYGNETPLIRYEDPVLTLERLLPEIKAKEKPDAIIVASHLGVYADKQLAGFFPDVNAWFGGHSHTTLYYPERFTHPDLSSSYVAHAGASFDYVGILALGIKGGRNISRAGGLIEVSDAIRPDSKTDRLVDPLREQLAAFDKVVVTSNAIISGNGRTGADTRLGNLVTDMIREELAADYGPIDVAIFNRTGLRASLPKGEITLGHLFELFPFGNSACVLEMTGAQVQAMLDNSAKRRGDAVSGLTYTIKDGAATDIQIGGQPLEAKKTYRVATNSYMAKKGGSGYAVMLEAKKVTDTGREIRDMLIAYLERLGELKAPTKTEERTRLAGGDLAAAIRSKLGINDDGRRRDRFGHA